MTVTKCKPIFYFMLKTYTQKPQFLEQHWLMEYTTGTVLVWSLYKWCPAPLSDLTLIKTQSIPHYINATDMRGLEVSDHQRYLHWSQYGNTPNSICSIFHFTTCTWKPCSEFNWMIIKQTSSSKNHVFCSKSKAQRSVSNMHTLPGYTADFSV